MKYILTSRREEAVTIDGLGVLPAATREGATEDSPGELVPSVTVVDRLQAGVFAMQRSVTLANTKLPEGVTCTVNLEEAK